MAAAALVFVLSASLGAWVSEWDGFISTASVENRSVPVKVESQELSSQSEFVGPLEDCLKSAALYLRGEQLNSDCTSNYVHYYPTRNARSAPRTRQASAPRPAGTARIGSFNLFHLGDGQAIAKHVGLVAKIIDRWDVAAVQELMPLPTDYMKLNRALYDILERDPNRRTFAIQNWATPMPGYLQVLHELRALDPSWSLILQPVAEGEGMAGEMAGFYYRSSRVALKEMPSCPPLRTIGRSDRRPPNFACFMQVQSEARQLMSRNAFAAYFQIDNFDFVGVTTHVRFRAADQPAALQAQAAQVCENFVSDKPCKPPKDLVGRFYEVKAVADRFADLKRALRDEDVIYMGDYNVELNPKTLPYWNAALSNAPGMTVFQTEPTTVSVRSGKLASNYDHFILNTQASRECSPESIRMLDLTQASKSHPDPVFREIGSVLNNESVQAMINDYKSYVERLVQPVRTSQGITVGAWKEKDRQDVINSYMEACQRMRANIQGAILELISDHMPIEMDCRTNGRDDD
ncbi:MAG: hypothetical protein NDI61_02665 [Bdellovibrionaceae bacterium]|nr:hypothetical protein [Pseudobdellovibrionaceae bacterium]